MFSYSNEVIDNLRSYYYETIMELQYEKDILKALPDSTHSSFFQLIDGIIDMIKKEIKEWEELGEKEEFSASDIELFESLKLKEKLCEIRKSDAIRELENEQKILATGGVKKMIFATTDASNVYLERDIKGIKPEFYDRIIEAMECLENWDFTKVGGFSSNESLVGIYKISLFQVRLDFRILDGDCVYVLGVRNKKDDNSRVDNVHPANRKGKTNKQFVKLKKLLSDPEMKMRLIEENIMIKERIKLFLQENKRGDRKHGR